jgi:hypothetical protein
MNAIALQLLDFLVPFGVLLRRAPDQPPFANWPELLWRFVPQTYFGFWLFSLVPWIGGFVYMLVLVPISARRHAQVRGLPGLPPALLLQYFVVILIGFGGLWSATGHLFMADWVAGQIGWPAGSPFQTELAFATLGLALAALLAVWISDHLITAVVIAKAVFLLGAAYVHLLDAIAHGNYSPLNIGTPLVGDVVYPALLLTLLWRARNHRPLAGAASV